MWVVERGNEEEGCGEWGRGSGRQVEGERGIGLRVDRCWGCGEEEWLE